MVKRAISLFALMLTVSTIWTVPSYAADAPKIGYVDLRKIMLESKAGKRIRAEIEKMVKERQGRLAHEEQEIKELQQKFEKQQLVLTDAQKKEKQKEFQNKVQSYQKMAKEAQNELRKKDAEESSKALAEIKQVVAEIAKTEKLLLVFDKNDMPALYAADGPDLTDKVLKKYDTRAAD